MYCAVRLKALKILRRVSDDVQLVSGRETGSVLFVLNDKITSSSRLEYSLMFALCAHSAVQSDTPNVITCHEGEINTVPVIGLSK